MSVAHVLLTGQWPLIDLTPSSWGSECHDVSLLDQRHRHLTFMHEKRVLLEALFRFNAPLFAPTFSRGELPSGCIGFEIEAIQLPSKHQGEEAIEVRR